MAKISSEGIEKLVIVKNALDSMFDKLEKNGKFNEVKDEFEAIAGIVDLAGSWEEVQ